MIKYQPFLGKVRLARLGWDVSQPPGKKLIVQILDRNGRPMNWVNVSFEPRGEPGEELRRTTDISGFAEISIREDDFRSWRALAFLPEGSVGRDLSEGVTAIHSTTALPAQARSAVTPAEVIGGIGGAATLIAGFLTSGDLGKGLIATGAVTTGISIYSMMTRK